MKKFILMTRRWVKTAASKTMCAIDDLLSGSPSPPFMPSGRMDSEMFDSRARLSMGAQRSSYMGNLAAQQAGMMGGLGGQLLNSLLGNAAYPYPPGRPQNVLQEGKVNVQVKLTRIDKEHILVEVECLKRIVHNAKELRELTSKLIEEHAEEFLFGELAKKDVQLTADTGSGRVGRPGTISPTSKLEVTGSTDPKAKEVMKK